MKQLLSILFSLICVTVACGQQQDICSHLQATGRVAIVQDNRLCDLVGNAPKSYVIGNSKSEANNTVGYRIRVFSGNQQTTSKNRCYTIKSTIEEKMPELPSYVTFKSPNWRISVGDFRTSEEASSMLAQLRKEFPQYANEMFIVKEKINL